METMPGIKWKAFSRYVDIDTGEIITEAEAKRNYIIIITTKYAKINHIQTKGTIEYTKQCRRNPQQKFNFNS